MRHFKQALQITALGLLGFGLAWLANKPLRSLASSITIPGITSVTGSCGIGGGPITSAGTLNGQEIPNVQTGTTYAILSTDCGKVVAGNNGSAQAYTIAAAGSAGFPSGYYVDVRSAGAGTITITPTTSTINGASTLALTTGQSARIISDPTNTNYIALLGSGTGGSSTTGPGITVYSGISPTLTGTVFFPIGGGVIASGTEASVNTPAPFASSISNFYVQTSQALGVGNSVVFTWRKAGSSQTLTCTISGAAATSCNDTTHSFTVAAGDLIDIQAVSSGTIIITPIVLMTVQFGTNPASTGILGSLYVSTDESTSSASFTDLATLDTVTFSLTATTNVAVNYGATQYLLTAQGATVNVVNIDGSDVAASGPGVNTVSFITAQLGFEGTGLSVYLTSLAAGSHTIKIRHRVTAGTGHWEQRLLTISASL